ncbi:MAG: MEDS domain-containing protein [Chloroflexi bacterium]|nr:MEDS domain-containing protein [Chloroflexota bacterium]
MPVQPHGVLAALEQGMHACLLYEDHQNPIPVVAPFIVAGLAAGERCIYVVGDHDPAEIRRELHRLGVDVPGEEERGALVLVTQWEVAFTGETFDPAAMIAYVRTAILDTLVSGFAGLRVVAEMTWALRLGVGCDRLIHYEALGNHLYPDEPLVAVCMYNRSRFPAAVCHDALRSHPAVVLDDTVYDNLFFELPEAMIDGTSHSGRLEWMLGQLKRARSAEETRLQLARAEEAVRLREEFVATAAHELRTPLTSLLGQVQLARRRLTRELDAIPLPLERALGEIERQSRRLNQLVGQLLDTSQLDGNRLPLNREMVDLAALVEEVVGTVRLQAERHEIVLRAPGPVLAEVDPLRVEQVITNLLANAVKFSPAGGAIELEVTQPSSDQVQVIVRDWGIGVPPDAQERIFEKFYQAHDTLRSSGSGLGLYLSRQIVELHGGSITVASPPDGGSRFTVSLPVRPADRAPDSQPSETSNATRRDSSVSSHRNRPRLTVVP